MFFWDDFRGRFEISRSVIRLCDNIVVVGFFFVFFFLNFMREKEIVVWLVGKGKGKEVRKIYMYFCY